MESDSADELLTRPLLPLYYEMNEKEYKKNSTNFWPRNSGAEFLFNASGKCDKKIPCRLEYNAEAETINLIASHEESDNIDSGLFAIKPYDIIGVELEISFDSEQESLNNNGGCEDTPVNRTGPQNPSALATLHIYTYTQELRTRSWCSIIYSWFGYADKKNEPQKRIPKHYHLPLVKSEDFGAVNEIVKAIRSLAGLECNNHGKRRLLVILNPHSGTGQAQAIYDETVDPMLCQAGVEHSLFVTKYAGHASARMLVQEENGDDQDIYYFSGIVTLVGDGILNEVLHGLQKRPDYEETMKKLTFGVVPCGTCNGLAKSVLHASEEHYGVVEASFLICKGAALPIDLSTYQTVSRSYRGFLTYSYGFVADCDLESECLHFLGPLRIDIWAVWRILALRRYGVRFSYLPSSQQTSITQGQPLPSVSEPLSEDQGWHTIEDDMITIWACQTSHASYNLNSSPQSKLDDGIFHIMLVRGSASRLDLIQIFTSIEAGDHINLNQVEFIKCTAFRVEPVGNGITSFNDVDGEAVEDGIIQAQVNPKEMKFFIKRT